METNVISPRTHGIIDYAFSSILMAAPKMLGLNKKAVRMYRLLGINLSTYNIVTDHGAGLAPLLSVDMHKKIDYVNVALIAALGFSKSIRKEKKAMAFHAAMSALAIANVALTDWDAETK